jgi:hypothetical protein
MTTGIYLGGYPSDKFSFTRSYACCLSFLGDSADVEQSGDTFTMWIDRPTGYGITYILRPYILPWSSNGYTLDYVVHDCWWHQHFNGIRHPQVFTVNFWFRGSPVRPTLTIVQPAAGVQEKFFPLPGAPSAYWLPPVCPD